MTSGHSPPANQSPFEFGGQFGYYTDVETGLLCLTHRYYDPGTGRFINRDPIAILFGLGPGTATYLYNEMLEPQSGPADGFVGTDTLHTKIAQINDGSPDIFAVRAFNTLEGLDVPNPIFWEDIGSQIDFKCIPPYTSPPVAALAVTQVYPTYYEYVNGASYAPGLVKQAPKPTGNFNTAPYPFGTVTSVGLPSSLLPLIPAGRNGLAALPADPSSRNPPPAYAVHP